MSSLRLATPQDHPAILRMTLDFYQASPYSHMNFDVEKVSGVISAFINGPLNERVALLLVDPEPVGVLLIATTDSIFSHDKFAGEVIWWVDHEYRNYKNVRTMINAYDYWSKTVGAVAQQLVAVDDKMTPLYKRLGFRPVEWAFIKDVK